MMTVASITWTRFLDKGASSARELKHDWRELVEHLQHAGPYAAKAVCPWIKLARFGTARSGKGALRHDGNLVEITGVEGDYDGEQMQPEEALQLLERANLCAVVYTSPSHKPDAPRWRVLAPLSHAHQPADRTRLLARVNGALGGVLTGESFTLSQSYYYGRVAGQADYRVLVTFDDPDEGNCVDLADELDAVAVAKAPRVHMAESGNGSAHVVAAKVEQLGRRLRTGDGRRELLKSYIGDKSNRGLSADEVRTLVDDLVSRFFDSSDPIDWSNINGLITDITDADGAQRAQVQATVGGFVERVVAAQEAPTVPALRLRPSVVDFTALRAVRWVLNGFIAAGEVVVWAGQPGVGKSTTFAAIALVVAGYGAELGSDIENDRPRRVVIVSEHAGQYERIFYGFCKRYGLDAVELMQSIVLFDAARLKASEVEREVLALVAQVGGDEPPLVVLDTASASFEVADENSNAEIGGMLSALKQPVTATGAPLWIIAHAAKALGREDAEITPRGASAYIGDVNGTGSVFRDKHFPASTFIRSLKNRAEREYSEIEVRTEVSWYEVADERGVIQRLGIRTGVPMRATEARAQAGQDAHEGAAMATAVLKSNRAKGNALQGALIALLVGAQNRTLKNAELVNALVDQGFKHSPIYRAIDQLAAQGVLTKAIGRVHLNGQGAAQES